MNNGVDLILELECICNDEILKGLLTLGKKYTAVRYLNIGDFIIESDDEGSKRPYKCCYFKVTKIIDCDYCFYVGDTFK